MNKDDELFEASVALGRKKRSHKEVKTLALMMLLLLGCCQEPTKATGKRQYWEGVNNDRCYNSSYWHCGLELSDCDSGQSYYCMHNVISGVEK